MSIRIHSAVVLLTGAMLTMTAVGQSTDQSSAMQKKHAACEHMTGQKQTDCEKRMSDMDKKNRADVTPVPTNNDKQPPAYSPRPR